VLAPIGAAMKKGRWTLSWVALAVGAVLVVLSVGGYFLLQHSVNQQEAAQLDNETTDAGVAASQAFSGIVSALSSDAAAVQLTDASPSGFLHFVDPTGSAQGPLSVNLVRQTGDAYVVVAATGTGFTAGQALTGAALSTVQQAKATGVTTGPVTSNGKVSYGRFALRVPGNLVIYEQFKINPHINIAASFGHAFSQLNLALYGPGPAHPDNLLIVTTKTLPLAGPTSQTTLKVGASTWTLVAAAKSPFVSGLASSGPIVLLVLGLLIALTVVLIIEIVQRRHRYAQALVEERTADLNASLQELRDAQDALVQSERLSAVGEMASVIGHELRNPLAAVTNSLFIVRGNLGADVSETTDKYLTLAEHETSKAATLADDLTDFVRPRDTVKSEVDVQDLVEEVMAATPNPPGVTVELDVQPINVNGDRGQLAEILTNLVTNSYQAMPDGGTLRVGAARNGSSATFTVEDTGEGVDAAVVNQVFDPFFTTKSSGTGLGLAIVQRLVHAHQGQITIQNTSSGGARVTVVLPVVPEPVAS
jgi:signal transduction histidine kinase